MSAASFPHSSFLQTMSAVMLWLVHAQKVPSLFGKRRWRSAVHGELLNIVIVLLALHRVAVRYCPPVTVPLDWAYNSNKLTKAVRGPHQLMWRTTPTN